MTRAVPKLQLNPNTYGMPGKVLQIDGDKEYLKICLDVYAQLGIPAVGVAVSEQNQYKEVRALLEKYNPDILVITGHDAMTIKRGDIEDMSNYRNSSNFVKTVKEARKWQPNLDNLVIFAGHANQIMKNNKCRSKLCKFAWKNNDTCIRPCFYSGENCLFKN